MRTQTQIDQVVRTVRSRIADSNRSSGFDLEVPESGYVQDDDWLSIVVAPGRNRLRAHEYVAVLSDVERELRASGVDHVLLVPAIED